MMTFSVHLTDMLGESSERATIKAQDDKVAFHEATCLAVQKHKIIVSVKNVTLNEADVQQLLDEAIES